MTDSPARFALLLQEIGADVERSGPRTFVVRVPTLRRGPVAVLVELGERTLRADAFYMRGPDRDHASVYRRVLQRNLEGGRWHFALDGDGDLYLVLRIPLAGVDARTLDELLGEFSVTVDETFEGVMRLGFDVPAGTPTGPPPAAS